MNHIVDTCPLTKCEGGLNLLHEEADDDAVTWLESTATAALAQNNNDNNNNNKYWQVVVAVCVSAAGSVATDATRLSCCPASLLH